MSTLRLVGGNPKAETKPTLYRPRMVGFMVTFLLPEGATQETAGMYVAEAIQQYRGCLRPPDPYGDNPADTGDPMFHLDPDNVRVQAMRIQS